MRIAYLINQYPKVSHSFIRREILALERQGFDVTRISVRGWDNDLVDEADLAERRKTRYVLQSGWLAIAGAVLSCLVSRPSSFRPRFARLPFAWDGGRTAPCPTI